jgi:hypothetical protein
VGEGRVQKLNLILTFCPLPFVGLYDACYVTFKLYVV